MPRPEVSPTTERLFALLEPFRRAGDETLGWPLLRFVSVPGDLLDEVRSLIDAYDRKLPDEGGEPGDTSALVDPAIAAPEVLPWLAQFFGVNTAQAPPSFAGTYGLLSEQFPTYADLSGAAETYGDLENLTTERGEEVSTEDLRALLSHPGEGWRIASRNHLVMVVRRYLTGSQFVEVTPNYGGDRWEVRVRTFAAETPRPWALQPALERARAIPVGVNLVVEVLAGATYSQLASEWATYADLTASAMTYAELANHVP